MRKWIKPHAAASSKFIVNVPLRLLEGDTYAVYYVLGWNGEEAVVGASRDDALSLRIVPTLSLPRNTIAALREIQKLSKRLDDSALPGESLGPADFWTARYIRDGAAPEAVRFIRVAAFGGRTYNQVLGESHA
jgi:hypothetical protein